ncbi:MAG: metallophosphoesterase family protein [Thermodesulfobacteriota bacterium]
MDGFAKHRRRIGLIADSHGSVSALSDAIATLADHRIDHLIHLGDFCDSVNCDSLPEVFSLLEQHRVQVVKGNNDYQVEKMLANGYFQGDMPNQHHWLKFLQTTPIMHVKGNVCFAHSLPFDTVRAFYEPVDTGTTERAAEVFKHSGYHALFCGHSHQPVFFRNQSGSVTRETVPIHTSMQIDGQARYIFIVGSADNGECGIFDLGSSCYERIKFER